MAIEVAVIGAGGIGSRHAAIVADEPNASVRIVCDVSESRAREVASTVEAQAQTSVHEAVSADGLDAVYITTPPRERVEIVRAAAERGLAIFCEKPLAATISDAKTIVDLVATHDVPCMVGFCSRFAEPCNRLKSLIDDRTIGEPVTFWSTRAGWGVPSEGNWRVDPEQACGITIESASHNIDLLRWLGGEIVSASGATANITHPTLPEFDDNLVGIVSFASGAIGAIQNSWTSHVRFLRHGVIGTEGAALVEGDDWWQLDRLTWSTNDSAHTTSITFDQNTATDMGYRGETQAFLEAIETGAPPPVDAYDGYRTVELSTELAGIESSR